MNRYRTAILFSGGMDSVILAQMRPGADLLYVDVGSQYSAKERRHLPQHVRVVEGVLDLGRYERNDAIIAGRNLALVLVAVAEGYHDVLLGATAGDASRDKDRDFALAAGRLLTYMMSGKHWPGHPGVHVLLPLQHMDKPTLVAAFLRMGGQPQALLDSVSCYHPTHVHCGQCKSCVRKWVALESNNIVQPPGYWAFPPQDSMVWAEARHKLMGADGGWRGSEDAATREVLRRYHKFP